MKKTINRGVFLALVVATTCVVSVAFHRVGKTATAIESQGGLLVAINNILENADVPGLLDVESTGNFLIQATGNTSVDVFSSTGVYSGTLSESEGTVNWNGACTVPTDQIP